MLYRPTNFHQIYQFVFGPLPSLCTFTPLQFCDYSLTILLFGQWMHEPRFFIFYVWEVEMRKFLDGFVYMVTDICGSVEDFSEKGLHNYGRLGFMSVKYYIACLKSSSHWWDNNYVDIDAAHLLFCRVRLFDSFFCEIGIEIFRIEPMNVPLFGELEMLGLIFGGDLHDLLVGVCMSMSDEINHEVYQYQIKNIKYE